MIIALYGVIIIIATMLGAFVGLGGGVIIKPLLDLIGHDSIDVVNFVSSCAVFSMSISSTVKHVSAKTKIDFKFVVTISIGAVLGGIGGSALFDYLLTVFDNGMLKALQGLILGLLLVLSVIYVNVKNAKSFNVKNPVGIVFSGLVLGFTASFLGVGGGPINVAFLVLFFSMTMKDAAVYSVATIFFSQLSKLITIGISGTVPSVSGITLAVAIVCAVSGGIIGAKMNKKFNEKKIRSIFTIVVAVIAGVNFYNAVTGFIS
ncbi:MAG: sulfite exporter TauE/SafE family protein [Eubacterium sp.]|nr:sulfite exporter TauE/SafE family protein [Eubacterium sp.]